jgi:hypothetical protein
MVIAPNVFVRAIVLQLQDLIVVLSAGGLRQQKQEKDHQQRARPDIPEEGRGIDRDRWNEKKREKGSVCVRERRASARARAREREREREEREREVAGRIPTRPTRCTLDFSIRHIFPFFFNSPLMAIPDEVIVQLERELRLMEADYQCTLQAEPSRTAINRSSHSVFHPILCQIACMMRNTLYACM